MAAFGAYGRKRAQQLRPWEVTMIRVRSRHKPVAADTVAPDVYPAQSLPEDQSAADDHGAVLQSTPPIRKQY